LADTDYYTYSIVKTQLLSLSDDTDQTLLDQYGADATVNTNAWLTNKAEGVPLTGANITNDVKRRTNLLVAQWFKEYIHQYTAAAEFEKQRKQIEVDLLDKFKATPTDRFESVVGSTSYRSEPLLSRDS